MSCKDKQLDVDEGIEATRSKVSVANPVPFCTANGKQNYCLMTSGGLYGTRSKQRWSLIKPLV